MTMSEHLKLDSVSDMLAFGLAVVTEASERYAEMAEAMDAHNNTKVAEIFREMADIEELHAEGVQRQISQLNLDVPKTDYQWTSPEGPETGDFSDLHYLMTPREALLLALHNEKRAATYFADVAEKVTNDEVKKMAQEMAKEEQEHVQWVEKWLLDYPDDENEWVEDNDPPVEQG